MYVVLTYEAGSWVEMGKPFAAKTARAAIRQAIAAQEGEIEGTFVAIPAKSWRPLKVQMVRKLEFRL